MVASRRPLCAQTPAYSTSLSLSSVATLLRHLLDIDHPHIQRLSTTPHPSPPILALCAASVWLCSSTIILSCRLPTTPMTLMPVRLRQQISRSSSPCHHCIIHSAPTQHTRTAAARTILTSPKISSVPPQISTSLAPHSQPLQLPALNSASNPLPCQCCNHVRTSQPHPPRLPIQTHSNSHCVHPPP